MSRRPGTAIGEGSSPDSLLARVAGVLYLAGSALTAIALLLPHPVSSDERSLSIVSVGALCIGVLFLAIAPLARRWMIHAGVATGSVLICLALYFAGAIGVYGTMFVWIAAFVGLFFSRRAAALQMAWLLTCYAITLGRLEDGSGYSPFTRVLVTGIALTVVVGLTSWLVTKRRLADERNRQFFDLSRDLLCTTNVDGYFLELNRAWTELLGHSREELRSRPYLDFVHPDDRVRTEEIAARLFDGHDVVDFENRYRDTDGEWHWLSWSASISDETGLVFARATDITEAKRIDSQRRAMVVELGSMARTDPLTGIPNRRWLDDVIDREMALAAPEGRSLALAMLDLDRFKAFNDAHGHGAGDDLLRETVDAWRGAMRVSDFLARYGGEEFVVLIAEASPKDAHRLVDRIRLATPGSVTTSAGVAIWDGVEGAAELMDRADAALYSAKEAGRDRTVLAELGVPEEPVHG